MKNGSFPFLKNYDPTKPHHKRGLMIYAGNLLDNCRRCVYGKKKSKFCNGCPTYENIKEIQSHMRGGTHSVRAEKILKKGIALSDKDLKFLLFEKVDLQIIKDATGYDSAQLLRRLQNLVLD